MDALDVLGRIAEFSNNNGLLLGGGKSVLQLEKIMH
jgi:hypothetical protein